MVMGSTSAMHYWKSRPGTVACSILQEVDVLEGVSRQIVIMKYE
jgi:hypothetical protein